MNIATPSDDLPILPPVTAESLRDAHLVPALEALISAAAAGLGCPMAAVAIAETDNFVFVARRGLPKAQACRPDWFCESTLRAGSAIVVPDIEADPRYRDRAASLGLREAKFYAGVPLMLPDGGAFGTLCVLDTVPRNLTEAQLALLTELGIAASEQVRCAQVNEALRSQRMADAQWVKLVQTIESMASIAIWRAESLNAFSASEEAFRLLSLQPHPTAIPLENMLRGFAPADRSRLLAAFQRALTDGESFELEVELPLLEGGVRRLRWVGDSEPGGQDGYTIMGALQDNTQRHATERQLWLNAHVDPLCGLPNRKWFHSELSQKIGIARQTFSNIALMLMDLDRFKEVNDTLGHQAGDQTLIATSNRLREVLGPNVFISRLAGDEFAILIEYQENDGQLERVAGDIIAAVRRPIRIGDEEVFIGASLGIARFPEDAKSPHDLLRRADMALYKVKGTGRGTAGFFGVEISSIFDARRLAIEKVRRAAAQDRIVPFYQPRVRMSDGKVIGFEALARIRNPDGSISGTQDFRAALVDGTSLRLMHHHIVAQLVEDLAKWRELGIDPGAVSFNAMEYFFQVKTHAKQLVEMLDARGIPHDMVEVEVTENVLWGERETPIFDIIEWLHSQNIRVSLDDFGIGRAALSQLRDLPIDCVKLDKSFIDEIGLKPRQDIIVESIVTLGKKLGVEVLAEGIETQRQVEALKRIGCETAQGFIFGHPMPFDEATDYCREAAKI